ncbi:4Fe-4S binding protein [Candidatus Bipolaricaulota bacterium]
MSTRIGMLCFSPTTTTKTICQAVAEGMGEREPYMLDMTLPDSRKTIMAKANTAANTLDHVIVGAPVYSGKLPRQVLECLSVLNGHHTPCSAIVVYGNREYGIALYTMVEILVENGFAVKAAGAFIGQHSYSDIVPVALGRPDESDLTIARTFGVNTLDACKDLDLHDVPRQHDKYSNSDTYTAIKPTYRERLCIHCGKCSKACPIAAISSETGSYVTRASKKQCIGCMACVYNCRQKARVAKVNPVVKMVMKRLFRDEQHERKEPLVIVA